MQFSFWTRNIIILLAATFCCAVLMVSFIACDEATPPPPIIPDDPPQITLFNMNTTVLTHRDTATISFGATDDFGIDSAIVDYGTPSGIRFKRVDAGKHLSGYITRQWGEVGFFTSTFTVYDRKGQVDRDSIFIMVFPDTINTP